MFAGIKESRVRVTGLKVAVRVGHNSPRAEKIRNIRPVQTSRILGKQNSNQPQNL
jgi:hypothetical protein